MQEHSRRYHWAQLVRLPNVFTVIADISAAFLLVGGGPYPLDRLVCVLLAGIGLYWAGMILNDVFDLDQDRVERPCRPLASGAIPLTHAKLAGWACLLLGVVLSVAAGYLPSQDAAATWLPGAIGVCLAAMIVAYDGPLKKTPLAPAAMGSCRVLSFLLGAAPLLAAPISGFDFGSLIPKHVLLIACGFGIYIMGITTMGRREAAVPEIEHPANVGSRSALRDPNLSMGLIVMVVGVALLAFAPSMSRGGFVWQLNPNRQFPILVALIAAPVVIRAIRMHAEPSPQRIQTTIRAGILCIIPLSAAFAFLGAGPMWGLAVFSLMVPALYLATQLRVT